MQKAVCRTAQDIGLKGLQFATIFRPAPRRMSRSQASATFSCLFRICDGTASALIPSTETSSMAFPRIVTPQDVGMVRIYLKPRDRAPGARGFLRPQPPLYRELVLATKADGIMNTVAHH